jgi:HSP20 family protein
MHACERFHGAFTRAIQLPEHADPDAIEANFGDGVLTVTVPKAATAQARRIPVQSARGAAPRPERN